MLQQQASTLSFANARCSGVDFQPAIQGTLFARSQLLSRQRSVDSISFAGTNNRP